MTYDVISTGSKGNAVVINSEILIDCGVSFKKLSKCYKNIKLVLITHSHADHINKITSKKLAKERPTLRFGCNEFCADILVNAGIPKKNIDVLLQNTTYSYGRFSVSPVSLTHDVPCFGYRIFYGADKLFYATDTGNLDGIEAKDYNLYLVECNYDDDEIQKRIADKEEKGEYAYEYSAMRNHLSRKQCDDFIYANIGSTGRYVYLHQHEDKKAKLPRCEI